MRLPNFHTLDVRVERRIARVMINKPSDQPDGRDPARRARPARGLVGHARPPSGPPPPW
jgi:hypothetical protein